MRLNVPGVSMMNPCYTIILCCLATTLAASYPYVQGSAGHGVHRRSKAVHSQHCGQQLTDSDVKIVGGTEARLGELPWQVALKQVGDPVCGGTLISPRWLLTAAHCFPQDDLWSAPAFYSVAIATTDLNATSVSNDVKVSKIIRHQNYNPKSYSNDIALVKLMKPVGGAYVRPACLPSKGATFYGLTCTTSGWGHLKESSHAHQKELEDKLRKVSVQIQFRSNCTKSLGRKHFRPYHLCAGWTEGQRDTCTGDSGGPLVCLTNQNGGDGPDDRKYWTLAGIVSTGVGCGRPGKFGLYTDVGYYLDWIERTMTDNSEDPIVGK